jgi:hypothetical protein
MNAVAFVLYFFPFDVSRRGVIGRSMFDVHLYLVSYSIKLAVSPARGWAEMNECRRSCE